MYDILDLDGCSLKQKTQHIPVNILRMGKDGGQGGIRTLGTVSSTHTFQACSFDHSDTCPLKLQC